MDIRKIKRLIELLEESGINEIEIKEGEESVRISRGAPEAPPQIQAAAPQAPAPAPAPAPQSSGAPEPAEDAAKDALPDGHVVRAPMVGTFYRAPSPGAKTFVEEGQ